MNKKSFLIFFLIIIFLALLGKGWVNAGDEEVQTRLDVFSLCGNGICELALGETEQTCPTDCGCNNNGICEPERGEDSTNCPMDCPIIPPVPPGGVVPIFDTTPPVIFNLFIQQITLNSATISWETNELTLCQTQYGRTSEYKDGSVSEIVFGLKHSVLLVNLLPATSYHFKIICKDTNKNESETLDQRFVTLTPLDIIPPANVSEFTAIPGDEQIILTWVNPPDYDFKGVKIIRSDSFYPLSPWEGEVVYNDKGTSFIDTGLKNGVKYYYTAFAYDRSGNYASGSTASVVPSPVVLPPVIPPPVIPPVVIPPPPEVIIPWHKDPRVFGIILILILFVLLIILFYIIIRKQLREKKEKEKLPPNAISQ